MIEGNTEFQTEKPVKISPEDRLIKLGVNESDAERLAVVRKLLSEITISESKDAKSTAATYDSIVTTYNVCNQDLNKVSDLASEAMKVAMEIGPKFNKNTFPQAANVYTAALDIATKNHISKSK